MLLKCSSNVGHASRRGNELPSFEDARSQATMMWGLEDPIYLGQENKGTVQSLFRTQTLRVQNTAWVCRCTLGVLVLPPRPEVTYRDDSVSFPDYFGYQASSPPFFRGGKAHGKSLPDDQVSSRVLAERIRHRQLRAKKKRLKNLVA